MVTSFNSEFASFCEGEYARVYKACRAFTGNADVAYDATQEAFARALARWGRLSRTPWVGGWVMSTALNECRARLKNREVTQAIPDRPTSQPNEAQEVLASIKKLPLRQAQVVLLFYYGDYSIDTIAALLDISAGAVKSHLFRGRQRLHEALKDESEECI